MTSDTVKVTLYHSGRDMYVQRRCIVSVEPTDCYDKRDPTAKMIERARMTVYGRGVYILDMTVNAAKDLMP